MRLAICRGRITSRAQFRAAGIRSTGSGYTEAGGGCIDVSLEIEGGRLAILEMSPKEAEDLIARLRRGIEWCTEAAKGGT